MTLIEMQERLALYLTAERKILEGNQSWSVGQQSFTRANLGEIQSVIESLRREISMAQTGGTFGCSQMVIGGRR